MKDIELKAARAAFEAWWRGDLVDWQGHESVPALHAWEAWQARAAVEADRAQRVPDAVCDDDLSDLAHSANQEALSFGLSHDVFLRYFKEVRRRLLASTPAPAQQERKPMTDEINQCDGCRRGLPLKGGMHTGPGMWDKMVCQKHRYGIKE